jgi:hypothetical protein
MKLVLRKYTKLTMWSEAGQRNKSDRDANLLAKLSISKLKVANDWA